MNLLEQIFTPKPFNDGGGSVPNGGVGTILTITEAPTTIAKGEKCTIKGKIETLAGGAVKAATVNFSYTGTNLGTATTDILGVFIKNWTFTEAGIFYVIAKFEGVEYMFNPSSGFVRIEVTAPPEPEPEDKTAWEQLMESWNALPGWQKALIAGSTLIGAAALARPIIQR